MVVKKRLIILLAMLVLISFASAQEQVLTITSEKSVYVPGDTIKINAVIYNPNTYQVKAKLHTVLDNSKETYPAAIIPYEFSLNAKETKTILIYDVAIDKNFISDTYIVTARVLFDDKEIERKEIEFEVKDTLKEIEFEVNVCKDQRCKEKSKVFVKNQEVYLDYYSKIKDLFVKTNIEYPDRTTKTLTLPILIKTDQIGTYKLEVAASKEGYRIITKKDQFAVIGKQVEIQSGSVCNNNEICDVGENSQNCPQDCLLIPKDKVVSEKTNLREFMEKNKITLTIALGVLVFILLVIFVLYLTSRKREEIVYNQQP